MKALRYSIAFLTILFSTAIHAQFILTVNFEQMDVYVGKRLELRVTESITGNEVGRTVVSPVGSTDFSLALYVLISGRSYNVDFYVDQNGNGMYDTPPVDHAWRRHVANATMNTTLAFAPDDLFTDIMYPQFFPYSQYDATWGGRWRNLTFGSTDSIKANMNVTCDSIFASFMTAGVFGNPAPVMFDFAEALSDDNEFGVDTLKFGIPSPWTGNVYTFNGEVHGDIALGGVGLQFTGSMGAQQILCLYTVIMGGNPFANGFFIIRELSIENSAPELEVEGQIMHTPCNNIAGGTIVALASGGTQPYSYAWSNGDDMEVTTGLAAGTYIVTVTDAGGCTKDATFVVTEPSPVVATADILDATCYGICDGELGLHISGGTPPYSFIWNTGSGSESIASLCIGDYMVSIIDAQGCISILSLQINEPDSITIDNLIVTPASNGEANGTIEVLTSGGTPPYMYSLDGNAFISSNVFMGIPPGFYCVFIQDMNGCLIKSPIFEVENLSGIQSLEILLNWYPNPATTFLHLEADGMVSVALTSMHGEQLMYAHPQQTHELDLKGMNPGIYLLQISDGKAFAYHKLIIL